MKEYNIGDICRIRTWESMEREFEVDCVGIKIPKPKGGYSWFNPFMKELCGKPFTIKDKRLIAGRYRYSSVEGFEGVWSIVGDMLEQIIFSNKPKIEVCPHNEQETFSFIGGKI